MIQFGDNSIKYKLEYTFSTRNLQDTGQSNMELSRMFRQALERLVGQFSDELISGRLYFTPYTSFTLEFVNYEEAEKLKKEKNDESQIYHPIDT